MNKASISPAPKRAYHSPRRTAQKSATRRRILDALAEHLAAGTFDSLSMDAIADAAGVSPATLYRYFPSREALLDAIADETLFQRLGDLPYPHTPDEIAPVMARSFAAFDADRAFVRAYFSTELGRTARTRGRRRRIEAIQAALRPLTARLSEEDRVAAEAIISYLASIQAWVTIQDEFGLTGAQVGRAVTWAIDTLLADLKIHPEISTNTAHRKEQEMIVEGIRHTSARQEQGLAMMDGSEVTPLARSEETGGQYALFEVRDAPGGGPPLHRHNREDEAFYILEGEYEVHSEDGLVTRAGPGTFVHVRRGTVQAYRCVGPGQGRMLVLASPGGLERFFAELSAQPDFSAVAAVAAAHGIDVVGPPPE